MRIAMPVTEDEQVAHGWGKAENLAIVDVTDGEITNWKVEHVGWRALHDEGTHGSHHARVVRFCRDNEITDVIVDHMGEGMQNTLTKLGLKLHQTEISGAREAVAALIQQQ